MWGKSSFLWLSISLHQHIKLFRGAQEHPKAPKGRLPTSASKAALIRLLARNTHCWFRLFNRLLSCRHDHQSPQSVPDQVQKTDSPLWAVPARASSGSDWASLLRADRGHAREKPHNSVTNVCPWAKRTLSPGSEEGWGGQAGRARSRRWRRLSCLALHASVIWGFYRYLFHELFFITWKKKNNF